MTEPVGRPLAIITEDLDDHWRRWLAQRCEIASCHQDDPKFTSLLERASALVVRTYTRVDARLLARSPKLKVVARAGVGLDNIDVRECRDRGVEVVCTPGANTRAVVELVTALLLDAIRPRPSVESALTPDEWKTLRADSIAPRQLSDLTLGILGLGRVGGAMARVGAAFDMRVIYNDVLDLPESSRAGAQPMDVVSLFEQADVLSVHIDNRPSNRRFIDGAKLARLPSGAIFINASRGFVVDAPALAAWLGSDATARAILDVHDPEPIAADDPLLGLANVRLTPHIGAATATAHRNMSQVVEDVWRVLQGEAPVCPAPR